MSLDRSLKSASSLVRHRNVLTRGERLEKLTELNKWSAEKNSPLGLVKVGNRKQVMAGKEKTEATADGVAATPAVAGAKAAAPVAGAKGAAPAAGAKGAASGAKPAAGAKGAAPAAKPAGKK